MRAILSPYDLNRAETLAAGSPDPVKEEPVEPAARTIAASAPAPVGMRYRAAPPRSQDGRKRGFLGRRDG